MTYEKPESSRRIPQQGTQHRSMSGLCALTQGLATEAPDDFEAEADIGSTAELGYN